DTLFLHRDRHHPRLHSLPTRRSSDLGTTVERSNSMYSEYSTSFAGSCHSPCSFVGLNEFNVFFGATGQTQVVQGHLINWEDGSRGTKFRRHVTDGGTVR